MTFGLDLFECRKSGSAWSSPNLTSISIYEYINDLPKPGVRWKKTWEHGLASLPLLMAEYLSKSLVYLYHLSSFDDREKKVFLLRIGCYDRCFRFCFFSIK